MSIIKVEVLKLLYVQPIRRIIMKICLLTVFLICTFLFGGCTVDSSGKSMESIAESSTETRALPSQKETSLTVKDQIGKSGESVNRSNDENSNEKVLINIYYQDEDGYLLPVTRRIKKQEAVARAAVTGLIDSSISREELEYFGLYPTLPADTVINGINIRDGIATIDFGEGIHQCASLSAERNMVASVVYTLTQFNTVDGVRIWIDGYEDRELKYGTDIKRVLTRQNTMINPYGEPIEGAEKIDVYMCKASNKGVILILPVSVQINDSEQENIPDAVIRILCGESRDKNLYSELPGNVGLLQSSLREGVLTLDFNKGIKDYGGSSREDIILKQILFSMSGIEGVNSIRILIDGEKAVLPEGTDLSVLLTAPRTINDLIKQ
jgi:germination protein M